MEAGPAQPDSRRYAVSRRNAGIGDCLVCLGAAWVFARNTGRTLVADWRRSLYAADPAENLFSVCFETPEELAGVPFIGDARAAELGVHLRDEPSYWHRDPADPADWERTDKAIFAARDRAVALIRSGGDRPERTIGFDTCINDALVAAADARAFLDALQPVARMRARIDRAAARLPAGPVVGLHIRHGNGGAIGGHAGHWLDGAAAIERCRLAIAAVRARLGASTPVLVCSDSIQPLLPLRAVVPGVIRYNKRFRPIGAGDLHVWAGAHQGLEDALVEMMLLARTSVLIRYPPASFFSWPAAVALGRSSPGAATLYDLQRPWTADDPLASAIVPHPEEL